MNRQFLAKKFLKHEVWVQPLRNNDLITNHFSRWKFTNRNANLYWPIRMSRDCEGSRRWWICIAITRQESAFCNFFGRSVDCQRTTWPGTKRWISVWSHRNGFIYEELRWNKAEDKDWTRVTWQLVCDYGLGKMRVKVKSGWRWNKGESAFLARVN